MAPPRSPGVSPRILLAPRLHRSGPEPGFSHRHVSIDSVLHSGLSALLTNSAALRVTSGNIANLNTPGYVRRVVQQETLAPGGILGGVTLSDVRRAVNGYFDREAILAQGAFSRFDAQSLFMDQLNAAIGSPGDGSSLSSKLDALYAALGQASLDPGLLANRQGALYQFQALAQSVSSLADSLTSLRRTADQQIGVAVSSANSLIRQIHEINGLIQRAIVGGDTASGLLDQRDQLVNQLSQLVGIRVSEQPDGRLFAFTQDGVSLVGDVYVRLEHNPSNGPSYSPITFQSVDPRTGLPIGNAQVFDHHTSGGEIRGLLDSRDTILAEVGEELGAFAQSLAIAFNEQHNANSAAPPPGTMTGRQTGLLAGDVLGFAGAVTLGIADSAGALVSRIAVDFDAGTLSVDGGPATAFGATVGSFVTALNTALGGNGTAAFADGVLTLSAAGTDGIVIADEAGNPSSRGGAGFSHFFGLNDLFVSAANTLRDTGLTSADSHGFAPGGAITLLLKGPNGERVSGTVSVAGATIGDMIAALNTTFAGAATFALDANGRLTATPSGAYQGYDIEVAGDTTARGTTGVSLSQLFGLGTGQTIALAQNFRLTAELATAPQRLAFAQTSLNSATALSTQIVGPGDNRGLLALQALGSRTIAFETAGALPGRATTLGDYAATFYQDIGARGTAIDASRSAQDTRLQQAEKNKSESEGVNLDEELAQMMMLQQAYNAGARLIRVADELFEALLNVV